MLIKYLIVLMLFLPTASWAETRPWTSEERAWGYAAGAVLVADWLTTRDMTKRYNEGYYEMNPLLGRNPTTAQVNRHFAIGIPLTFLIAHYLDEYRKPYLMGVTVIEAIIVGNNLSIGLRVRY